MKERPILFNGPMVRAIMEGRKTQTRRVVTVPWARGQRCRPEQSNGFFVADGKLWFDDGIHEEQPCPYGVPGDLLWVRETIRRIHRPDGTPLYRADLPAGVAKGFSWRPSIHMPRYASRITLRVTNVRVERVQEISEADAKAEGVDPVPVETGRIDSAGNPEEAGSFVHGFFDLWDSINAKRGYGWDVNPWVWVVEFERVEVDR